MRGGDNCLFESTWERAINERIIYHLGNIDGSSISRQSLRNNVGMRSNGHDLVGDSLMHLLTSSSVTGLKVLKAGGTESGASLKEPEVENVSLILIILLVKKEANMSVRLFLSYELAEQIQRCDAIPSSMMAIASYGLTWGKYFDAYKPGHPTRSTEPSSQQRTAAAIQRAADFLHSH